MGHGGREAVRRSLVALGFLGCTGPISLSEHLVVPDALVRPPAAPATAAPAPPTAPPTEAAFDAAVDAGAAPDGGTGFRIVAGAAVFEAQSERTDRPKVRKAPPSAPPPAAASAPPGPRLSPVQTIRAHQGDVSTCYGRVALKDPSIRGRITVQWTIGKDGMPMAVAITEDTLKDKSVGACIKEKARQWRFPPPGGGVQVISYPFDLKVQ